jgi:hypothetical protein
MTEIFCDANALSGITLTAAGCWAAITLFISGARAKIVLHAARTMAIEYSVSRR